MSRKRIADHAPEFAINYPVAMSTVIRGKSDRLGAPDYAHWHGFFELQQDLYELEAIHKKRIETGTIEEL
jgi:hypothetical protein